MKRLLVCLVPWMAMTAAARQEAPRLVQVVYTNVGPAEAWRLGDECYIAPSVLKSWHWAYGLDRNEATIQAEDRTVKVATRNIHKRTLVPVKALFEQLGGVCKWRSRDELDVLGEVRMITLKDRILAIDSTLSAKAHVFSLTDPNRLVIDVRGMILSKAAQDKLPEGVDVSQYSADTVRVVYESQNVPNIPTGTNDPTRHFEYRVDFPAKVRHPFGRPDLIEQPNKPVQPNTGDPGTKVEQTAAANSNGQSPNPQRNNAPGTNAQGTNAQGTTPQSPGTQPPTTTAPLTQTDPDAHITLRTESDHQLSLAIQFSKELSAPARVQRSDPYTFEITLPGIRLPKDFDKIENPTIEGVWAYPTEEGSILKIKTSRPVGVQFASVGKTLELTLEKPVGGKLQGRVITVDPGHGGKDSGARSPDHQIYEKDLTLGIATELAGYLRAQGATVIMTRTDDTYIPLTDRADMANNNNADFFISVHINSNTINNSRSGTTTYYHGNQEMAHVFAECVQSEIVKVSGLPSLGVSSDFSRYDTGFSVLRNSRMPAILIETGFLNSAADREEMVTTSFQKRVARAIVKGIQDYLGDAQTKN